MIMTTGNLISFILGIVAESCNKKITDELSGAWSLTLTGIPNNYLIKGFEILMKEKKDNFMPHPGELRGICKGIQIARKRENALIENNQPLIDYSKIPQIAEQAKKITGSLKDKPKIKRPEIYLGVSLNPRNGNIKKITTPGHIDFDFFSDQCKLRHGLKPLDWKHGYRVWHKFKEKDTNGNFLRFSEGYVECTSDKRDVEKITVGYFV